MSSIGMVNLEGFRDFQGFGLERFNAHRVVPSSLQLLPKSTPLVHLFSDLNQWMLKVLLAPRIPESMLSAPREHYRSAAQLACAAGISVMSVSRLVRQLPNEAFIDKRKGRLRLVRIKGLLERWRGASHGRVMEVSARWIIRGGGSISLGSRIVRFGGEPERFTIKTFDKASSVDRVECNPAMFAARSAATEPKPLSL
jgi:hypothetical protein